MSWYTLFLLLGINVWGQEQEIEPINTDRPDQNEGTFSSARSKHNLSAGLKYLLTNDLQLDVIAGFSVFKSESDNFVALGVAYRFKNKNKQQNKQS